MLFHFLLHGEKMKFRGSGCLEKKEEEYKKLCLLLNQRNNI